jgi:hypothetical protein
MTVAPQTVIQDALVVDDAVLLDGAAAVWAVMAFAADLPTTPEQKEAVVRARARFLSRAQAVGLSEVEIVSYLEGRARDPGNGGSHLRMLPREGSCGLPLEGA